MSLFIQYAFDPATQFYYGAWVLSVIISIILHEMAHGWAAMRQGDNTPMVQERMSGNPLVLMGPFSMFALFLVGIAWGQMPVDPTRFKSKYGEAIVAAAGPAMNLLLALIGLTAFAVFEAFVPREEVTLTENIREFLWVFGCVNGVLMLFNLLPIPPLDGSHILANFVKPYARFISDPSHQGILFFGFAFAFIISSTLFGAVFALANIYATRVAQLLLFFA